MPAAGLKAVYTNTSVDFGTSDVGPLVLGIKNSGADAVYLPMVASSNFAVVQGLDQNNVKMKANVLATGYGQDLLDSPIASTLGPNTVLFQTYKPVEVKDKATKQFQADLKKYAGLTGVPDYGQYLGYVTCDLAILGLQHAGKTPTASGLHRRPPQARHLRPGRPRVRAGRHQPHHLREVPTDRLRVLHTGEERQVRGDEQGQAVHRQARRFARGSQGQRHRQPGPGDHDHRRTLIPRSATNS